jgi:hypothetical protein
MIAFATQAYLYAEKRDADVRETEFKMRRMLQQGCIIIASTYTLVGWMSKAFSSGVLRLYTLKIQVARIGILAENGSLDCRGTLVTSPCRQRSCMRVALLAILLPIFALADPFCLAGSVSGLSAQGPCTIGDLTFDFSNAQFDYNTLAGSVSGFAPNEVMFQTIQGAETGFTLSGNFSVVGAHSLAIDGVYALGELDLTYTVSAGPGMLLTGFGTELHGATLAISSSSVGCNCSDASVQAETDPIPGVNAVSQYNLFGNVNETLDQAALDAALDGLSQAATIPGGVGSATPTSFIGAGVSGTGRTASAYFTSADFTFTEQPNAIPEPRSLLLLATALAALFSFDVWRKGRPNNP